MKDESEILEKLIAGGLVGAALGALIKNDKTVVTLGALAGAAVFASYYASEKAKEVDMPLIVEEDGALYELWKGKKKLIKKLPKSSTKIQKEFLLKK